MTRRGATYVLVVAALLCLAISGIVHPYIAPLCLGWLAIQWFFLDRSKIRVPEGAVAMLHVWLGTIFLWFALIGHRGADADMLELLLGFGAPFLILKIVSPPTRFNEALTALGCIILAVGSAATAPGLLPVAILALFLLSCCLALPAMIRREPSDDDVVSMYVLKRPGIWRVAPLAAGVGLTVVGLSLGGLLYLFVPRLSADPAERMEQKALDIEARRRARRSHASGFARTIKLGDIGAIKRDDRVAFEAQCRYYGEAYNVPASRSAMLLMRLRAWDTYTPGNGATGEGISGGGAPSGGEWTRRLGKLKEISRDGVLRKGESGKQWAVDWSIRAIGYTGRTLMLPQRAGRVKSPGVRLLRGPAGSVVAEEPLAEYGVEAGDPITSRIDMGRLRPGRGTAALVHVPAEISNGLQRHLPRVRGPRIVDKITAIQRYFTQNNFRYTLFLPLSLPKDVDPLIAFLDRREGHCELFASAACMMLRLYGVPARMAGGMRMVRNMDASGTGLYRARFRNAHAWVEILCDKVGWVAVDFTPSDGRALAPTSAPGTESNEDQAALAIDGRGNRGAPQPPLFDWANLFAFDRADQARFRARVWESYDGRVLAWFGSAIAAWTLLVLARSAWLRRGSSPFLVRAPDGTARRTLTFYSRWLKLCASKGHRRARSQTPREFLGTLPGELRTTGSEITARFELLRYG